MAHRVVPAEHEHEREVRRDDGHREEGGREADLESDELPVAVTVAGVIFIDRDRLVRGGGGGAFKDTVRVNEARGDECKSFCDAVGTCTDAAWRPGGAAGGRW